MKATTILITFNDGSHKCVKSFDTVEEAINQIATIAKNEAEKFGKRYENYKSYIFACGTSRSIVYDGYFSPDRKIEFFPIGFETIELEIDD